MKHLLTFLLIVTFWSGCANSVSNEAVTNPDRNIVKNLYLQREVEILNHAYRYHNGLLEAMVLVHNKTKRPQDLEYRFIWLDRDGYPVQKEPWQPLTLNGLETRKITSIAHLPTVTDFKFEIRPKQ